MYIQEIFYSFQGEGILVGYPQIFIRLYGCNIKCAYCDTPDRNKTPMTPAGVVEKIKPLLEKKPHSISITGGEPMMQIDALKSLVPELKQFNLPLFLETNATYPERLKHIKDDFDYFSVDYKPGHETEFSAFLKELKDKPGVYVKYIVLKDFDSKETEYLGRQVAEYDKNTHVILQPVTPFADIKEPPAHADLTRAFEDVRKYVPNVRIIPQTHKYLGLR